MSPFLLVIPPHFLRHIESDPRSESSGRRAEPPKPYEDGEPLLILWVLGENWKPQWMMLNNSGY